MSAGSHGRGERAIGLPRRLVVLLLAVLAAVLVWGTLATDGSTGAALIPSGGCDAASRAPHDVDRHLHRPPQTVSRRDHLAAIVRTNCGSFEIALDARRAPRIVNSFVYLARSGFYDGLLFYRVVPDFIIQGGDPRNNGTGGPGYRVTEPPPRGFHYRIGTVAMANSFQERPGSAGSVFFVVTGQQGRYIHDRYAILGRVRAGLATVKRIGALGIREHPIQVVRIESIRIKQRG